jgi:hypothetical protein
MAIPTADFDDGAAGVPTVAFEPTDPGRRTIHQTLYLLLSQHHHRTPG